MTFDVYHGCKTTTQLHYYLLLQISHGGLVLLRNVKPEENEEIVEPVIGKWYIEEGTILFLN